MPGSAPSETPVSLSTKYYKYLQINIDRDYKVFNNIREKHYFFTDVSTSADSGDIDSVSKVFSLEGQFSAKHG
jgi:hypothetical protein